MNVYFYLNLGGFSNCYLVVNEKVNEALLIDPGKLTEQIINRIERKPYKLSAILITNNHLNHVHGLKTLIKIYSPCIYAADCDIAGNTHVITGDGMLCAAGLNVKYTALPGHTSDAMIYKIGNLLFTGDTLLAGRIGGTNSSYSSHILKTNIKEKIFSQKENTIIFPGYGPPTSVGAEKKFNIDMQK